MSSNRSVLRFDKYIVKSISFQANEKCYCMDDQVELDFDFDIRSSIEENKLIIELSSIIFPNAVTQNYPFEMEVVLKGFFSIDSADNNVDISFFKTNAVAILFPYLRAIVSSYTANANIAPVILPAMNINEYIRKKYQNVKKQA